VATLNDLVRTASLATKIPEATVFAYGRFAREAGCLSQKGRGLSAAEMKVRDAANLLIALGAASVTREAGKAIKDFRGLRGHLVVFQDEFERSILSWLAPLGPSERDQRFEIKADFGTTMEFLIDEAGSGNVHRFLGQVPTYELSHALWRKWKTEKSQYLQMSIDELARLGLIRPGFSKEVVLRQIFYRNVSAAEIEIVREWEGENYVAVFQFCKPDTDMNEIMGNSAVFRLSAQLDDQCLTGLGLALRNIQFPKARWPVDFFDYFGIEEVPQAEPALQRRRLSKVRA
jgi:hypothetical protein